MQDAASIVTSQNLGYLSLCASRFNELAARDRLVEIRRESFAATAVPVGRLTALGDVELADASEDSAAAVVRPEPDMLILVQTRQGQGQLIVAGRDREAVDRVAADVVAALRDPAPRGDVVPVTFWADASGQPMDPRRDVAAPAWDEVRANYTASVRDALDELVRATEPGRGGLILWHGEPGTGKSYALRALARAWRDWCELFFVTDAEVFLGGKTAYLLNALLRKSEEDDRWRLVVFEDAGELLAADARAVAGQALSRLLNLGDGILGAGLRTIVLLTTNEPLGRMHPAVVRPGRAWAQVEFTPLSVDEANAWLERAGMDTRAERPTTLAELYAIAEGRPVPERRPMGFVA